MFFTLKSRKVKVISWILIIVFLNEIIYPTAASALTSGNTQPEVWDYQPADATDNVSLTTGAFNYTIPITSVPEYPMAMSYRSGVKPDQEAGAFGYGFHSFSGAIARNLVGLPDDLDGGETETTYKNDPRWGISAGASISAGLFQDALKSLSVNPKVMQLNIGVSAGLEMGYDNYTGLFGAISFSANFQIGVGKQIGKSNFVGSLGIGWGIGVVNDSRNFGLSYGSGATASLSLSYYHEYKKHPNDYYRIGVSSLEKSFLTNQGTISGMSEFSTKTSGSNYYLSPLANLSSVNRGMQIGATVPLPIPGVTISAKVGYYKMKIFDDPIISKNFGFNYLSNYNRRETMKNPIHIADMSIEGENAFPDNLENGKPDPRSNPVYLQKDNYMVNAMGINGNMELFQKKYGVVSRNYSRYQFRDIGFHGINTDRKEVFPWHSVNQARFNRQVDILRILKKDDPNDADFDQKFFTETERASLTGSKRSFKEAEFKMKGDLAGELNLASEDFKDKEPNKYMLEKVSNTGGVGFEFFGFENIIPLYVPNADEETLEKFSKENNIKKSTDIKYMTIGDIVSKYLSLSKKADVQRNTADNFKFNQSFYSHYSYKRTAAKELDVTLNDNVEKFNILAQLAGMSKTKPHINSLIGGIEVKNSSGIKYIFNLPAFVKESKNLSLKGRGVYPPGMNGNDYKSFSDHNRNKIIQNDNYEYPYAWLLTAIVGDDYIDFDGIPGPSDGDLGFWVKFRYTKAAEKYRWRNPFSGLQHVTGITYTAEDDFYSMNAGFKEIYYLSEIESSGYLCKYNYNKRFDGLDAKAYVNGNPYNTLETPRPEYDQDMTGRNFQFVVTQIDLYKKNFTTARSQPISRSNPYGKIIKSTKFEYDYSLCPDVPNNLTCYSGFRNIPKSSISYIYNREIEGSQPIGTGKLTLRKIQDISYDEEEHATLLPSYNFNYYGDIPAEKSTYNPPFDPQQTDQWGNYAKNCATRGDINSNVFYYNHYCEYNEVQADINSKVYHLRSIALPSGGQLEIDYKAQSYGYVQDKRPYVMRRVRENGMRYALNGNRYNIFVKIDVDDICRDQSNKNLDIIGLRKFKFGQDSCLALGDTMYGEIAYYQQQKQKDEKRIYLASTRSTVISIAPPEQYNGKWYQELELAALSNDPDEGKRNQPPFVYECRKFMYFESNQMRAIKDNPLRIISIGGCFNPEETIRRYETMERDDLADVIIKMGTNFASMFATQNQYQEDFDRCYGQPATEYFPGLSFIRTPIYKAKYTGTRVHSIRFSDNFNYATNPDDPDNYISKPGTGGNIYYFDENSDGDSRSAGVATIEPGGGESCIIDMNKLEGIGYMPSPAIYSSKTTLEPIYMDLDASDNIRSRLKGKTVYEFYTPKDNNLLPMKYFKNTILKSPENIKGVFDMVGMMSFIIIKFKIFGIKVRIKIPMMTPAFINWKRTDEYHLKSYAYTDFSDIYGQVKSIKQLNASGNEEARQTYEYFDTDSGVPVYNKSFNQDALSYGRPGKMDQAWSEAYYTKESDIKLIPWKLRLTANTTRHFMYTTMKYSYIPPILQRVISTVDGSTTITENTGFDSYTGQPVEVRSRDSYRNEKIKRIVPAYWEYPGMGPVYENKTNLNMLTSPTASFLYLNECDNEHVLGASVTTWDKNKWGVIDYLQPNKTWRDTANYYYSYNLVEGNAIKSAYATAQASRNKYVSQNVNLYRPYETFTYEVELNSNGTFKTFTPFNYSGESVSNWKRINTNELYSAGGAVVQSRDILNKYSSQDIGYNNLLTFSNVVNSSYGAAVFEGAENIYFGPSLKKNVLEGNRVKLLDAGFIRASGQNITQNVVLNPANYLGEGHTSVQLVAVQKSASEIFNIPFAKLNLVYNNNVKRSIYISLKQDNNFSLVSDRGEIYDGFIRIPNLTGNQKEYILMDWNNIQSVTIDAAFPSSGFTTSIENVDLSSLVCTVNEKPYILPVSDNVVEVHTGKLAFSLNPSKIGTEFTISPPMVNAIDFNRKYKAMVWVHNSSPAETELVVQFITASGTTREEKTSLATPYVKAGPWSLLRIDFDNTTALYNVNPSLSDKVKVFMRNASSIGKSVYDDFRVLPFNATMVNFVYDPLFNRIDATLNADHFATYNKYDSRGRVVETIVELENKGKETVKKYLYNNQKKN